MRRTRLLELKLAISVVLIVDPVALAAETAGNAVRESIFFPEVSAND